ncbi:MAG: hypothetical protein ABI723_23975 [Bacteroidia bacterium]
MRKKSFKYLTIAAINLTILTGLLALWTDKLELTFHDLVRPIEFLKIIGFSIASLVGMRILVNYFRKRNITKTSSKIKIAALLTFLISSYLYIEYTSKFISNAIINRQFRNQIADKIKPTKYLAYGSTAENLSIKEYQEIVRMAGFIKLPNEASNIKYLFSYDGFLPDHIFTLTYDLPKEIKTDTFNYQSKDGQFTSSQICEIIGDKKRITYNESER